MMLSAPVPRSAPEFYGRYCDSRYAALLGTPAHSAVVLWMKGYVMRWKYDTNVEREALSEIEYVVDEDEKREITSILRASHNIATVNFF